MKREIVLATNVPAYCNVELPDEVGNSTEELRAFAEKVFSAWAEGSGEYVFEPEWENADEFSDRVVRVDEVDSDGVAIRSAVEGFEMNPPPTTFDGLRDAELACRAGYIVQGYLLAAAAHLTSNELALFQRESSPCKAVVVSATCAHGVLVDLGDALFEANADYAALLDGLSEGAQAVIRKARAFGLRSVRFDAQGPVLRDMPTYVDEPAKPSPGMAGP